MVNKIFQSKKISVETDFWSTNFGQKYFSVYKKLIKKISLKKVLHPKTISAKEKYVRSNIYFGGATIVQGSIFQINKCPRDSCPSRQFSNQGSFCPKTIFYHWKACSNWFFLFSIDSDKKPLDNCLLGYLPLGQLLHHRILYLYHCKTNTMSSSVNDFQVKDTLFPETAKK